MNQFCSTSGQTLNHINSGCTLHRELLDASLLVMLSEHIYEFNFNDLVVFLARACDNGCAGFLVSCCNFALLNIDLLGGGVLSCGWIHNSVKPEPCIDSSRQETAPASGCRPDKRVEGGGGERKCRLQTDSRPHTRHCHTAQQTLPDKMSVRGRAV